MLIGERRSSAASYASLLALDPSLAMKPPRVDIDGAAKRATDS